jgi:hypothetical protein
MSSRLKISLFLVVGLAQLGAAGWSIARYETVLASGTPYKIEVAPVDPADAFRGRYVAVQPSVTVPPPIAQETEQLLQSIQSGNAIVFVRLAVDEQGFARAAGIVQERPEQGDYLEIAHAWPVWTPRPDDPGRSDLTAYRLGFSFNRYYMNETAAPAAERSYFEARRNANRRAWLTVRVKDGVGVTEGLFIDGAAIEEVVRQSR